MYPPDSELAQTMLYIKEKMKGRKKSQNTAFQSNNKSQPHLLQIGSVLNSPREHTQPESNPVPSSISLFVNFHSEVLPNARIFHEDFLFGNSVWQRKILQSPSTFDQIWQLACSSCQHLTIFDNGHAVAVSIWQILTGSCGDWTRFDSQWQQPTFDSINHTTVKTWRHLKAEMLQQAKLGNWLAVGVTVQS